MNFPWTPNGRRFLAGAVPDLCISTCQKCFRGWRGIKVEVSLHPASLEHIAAPREDVGPPTARLSPNPVHRGRPPQFRRRPRGRRDRRRRGVLLEDDATPTARLRQEIRENSHSGISLLLFTFFYL